MNSSDKETLLLNLGERIRRMRLHHDKTSKEIAAYLNITTQAYGNMERGKSDISISRLMELSKLYEIPLLRILSEDHHAAIIQIEKSELISSDIIIEKKIG